MLLVGLSRKFVHLVFPSRACVCSFFNDYYYMQNVYILKEFLKFKQHIIIVTSHSTHLDMLTRNVISEKSQIKKIQVPGMKIRNTRVSGIKLDSPASG